MKRSEAYHILGKMWEDATAEQAEALSIAQNDIEFVDLMPNDTVAVVRCKNCKHFIYGEFCDGPHTEQGFTVTVTEDDFCSYGKRRNPDEEM